ncbi:AMP-binding protein [Nocardiopsis salina]|uniref:AMP-binding protein n=1 Tax=Nocardiopsis salina TaxID=245836 RepID=UPI00034661C3|nr:AMP-binding protein [Nocardiopsis salina]
MTLSTHLTPERIAAHTASGHWPGRPITDDLDLAADRAPARTAAVDSHCSTDYASLRTQVDRCAGALLDLGVRPGDVVSFQLPNRTEWIVLHLAATRIGAVSHPVIPAHREREVGYALRLARSKVLVVPRTFRGFDHVAMAERMRTDLPDLEHVVVVPDAGEPAPGGTRPWSDLVADRGRDPATLAALRPEPDDLTLLIFTSGTTGEPKGVMHTHNTLAAALEPLPARLGHGPDSVLHVASTFAHLTGLLYGVRLALRLGATGVYQEVWDPARFADLVERHRITSTSAATPFLQDVLSLPDLAGRDLSSLRRFCCMGAPVPRVLLRRARTELPGAAVLGGWGQTENALVTLGSPDDPEHKIVGTDGRPWPGMSVRVVDDAGTPLPAGEEGRLQVRGPFLFVGYAERPDLTEASFTGGWFETGDLACLDADGYVGIRGRTKDVIIRGGENIPVVYVENVLAEHPGIDTVAVVAVSDPRLQERACAVVTLADGACGLTLEDLRLFLADQGVAKPYWPERVEVVESLPRTPSGKIQKFRLRQELEQDTAGRTG